MKQEGFWYSKYEPHYPKPVAGNSWPGQDEFIKALKKVQRKAHEVKYRGFSTCRICNTHNGSGTYRLEEWEWPSGFIHYIEEHNVKPTAEFIRFVASKQLTKDTDKSKLKHSRIGLSPKY